MSHQEYHEHVEESEQQRDAVIREAIADAQRVVAEAENPEWSCSACGRLLVTPSESGLCVRCDVAHFDDDPAEVKRTEGARRWTPGSECAQCGREIATPEEASVLEVGARLASAIKHLIHTECQTATLGRLLARVHRFGRCA